MGKSPRANLATMSRQEEYKRIGAERAAAEKEAQTETRRAFFRAALECAGFCGLGLFIMFWAFWVDDLLIGRAFLWGGMAVGYAGMAFALLRAYRKGLERGDW